MQKKVVVDLFTPTKEIKKKEITLDVAKIYFDNIAKKASVEYS
jgi:hypothetical protein